MASVTVRPFAEAQAAVHLPEGFVLDDPGPGATAELPEGFELDSPKPLKPRYPGQDPLVDMVVHGLTFGFSPEIEAGLRSLFGGKSFKEAHAEAEADIARTREEHPIASTVAEIGGGALLPGGALLGAPTIIARALRGAGVGGATGALYGAGTGEGLEDRANRALSGGAVGAGLGAVLGPLAGKPTATPQLAGTTATGQQAVEAAERLGLEQFPRIAATENVPAKRIGLSLSKIPYAGTPIQAGIERSSQEVGKRAARVAEDFGGGSIPSRAEAGSAARGALTEYIGPTTSKRVTAAYDAVDKVVNRRVLSPLNATQKVASEIIAERGAAALRGTGTAVDEVAAAITRPSGLSYEGIKRLRTSIGEMLDTGILPAGTSGSELKRIYAALSADLKNAVVNSGGQRGLQAFERANKLNALVSRRREELAKLLGSKSDETLFDTIQRMAGSKGGANIDLLLKARKAMGADEWDEIASVVISRLGQSTKGNVETFSPAKFLTEYGALTPQGKAILFGSTGKAAHRQALDDIQKVCERLADLGQYANPSGTAQVTIGSGIGALGLLETFAYGVPLKTMTGLLGGRFVASALAKPATAQSMARWAKAYELAIRKPGQGTLAALNAASRRFAADAGEALGLRAHVKQIADALQGSVPGQAEQDQQN